MLFNHLSLPNKEPVEQTFLNDLLHAVEHKVTSKNKNVSQSYKPSSMYCTRLMYYQIIGVPVESNKRNASDIGINQSGTDRHERLQKAITYLESINPNYKYINVEDYVISNNIPDIEIIKNPKYESKYETKCYHKRLNLSFMTDGIIQINNKLYILEIKTETTSKHQFRTNIEASHIDQACCYTEALQLEDVIFLYENRDVCTKKAFYLHTTSEMRKGRVVDKIEKCQQYVNNLVPPPKDKTHSCKYCNYIDLCKRDK